MPRGAEYVNEPPRSDNAIEQGQDAAHGIGKVRLTRASSSAAHPWEEITDYTQTTDEAPISRPNKTAPLPEGLSEVNDRTHSAGSWAATRSGSGDGGHDPKEMGERKGLGALPGRGKV